jgi:hypothetical protein
MGVVMIDTRPVAFAFETDIELWNRKAVRDVCGGYHTQFGWLFSEWLLFS